MRVECVHLRAPLPLLTFSLVPAVLHAVLGSGLGSREERRRGGKRAPLTCHDMQIDDGEVEVPEE